MRSKLQMFFVLAASLAIPVVAAPAAQTPPATAPARGGGWRYNPASVITVKGTVQEVKEYKGRGGSSGTHLIVQTERHGTLDVHLGPTSYIAQKQFPLAKGDHVEITGSEVNPGNLTAREVTKSGKKLELREASGRPLWAGAGRGAASRRMTNPRPADPAPASGAAKGQAIFEQHCAVCHNANSTATKVGPGLKGVFERSKLVTGKAATPQDVRAMIENGHGGMPAFSDVLSKAQIDSLIAYLKTL